MYAGIESVFLVVLMLTVIVIGFVVEMDMVRYMKGNRLPPTLLCIAAMVTTELGLNFSNLGLTAVGVFMGVVLIMWARRLQS